MHHHSIRAHYEQLSEFERDRIIELKEGSWANRRIARHMGRSDAASRRYQAKPHTTRVAMSCLTACQTLPWPAISPDPSPVEHVWDMMERRLHLPGNVDDLA
ncbi:transposable element Tcb1 transposase [Trichonephila clavipes]|nr:transposable element Tcb1 transposase [Trichonephila clavipes]